MGTLSMTLDPEMVLDLMIKGKEKLISAKKDLFGYIAQEKVKREKTKRMNEKDVMNLEVALENTICSRAYLTKLQTYVECQKTWMGTLQSGISALETGTTKAAQNQEFIRQLQTRRDVLANPDWNPGLHFKSNLCEQVLFSFIYMTC